MNILVTGGAGYLGSVLIPKLIIRGHTVRLLDIGYFGVDHVRSLRKPVELIREDIRRICQDREFLRDILDNCQCIIHLAAISNDPCAELCPGLTEDVNFTATKNLAEAAKERGIRFIFSSSCSVYGTTDFEATEETASHPVTVYAESKVRSESAIFALADERWRPVVLRNGTLFGYSARMRFDLVVNIFSLYSTLYNEIKIFGDGRQWRPFLHVKDCARALVYFAELPRPKYTCYNILTENKQICELASIFQGINPKLRIIHLDMPDPDKRDYRVSNAKMKEEGFIPQLSIEFGAEELVEAICSGLIQDPESIYYRNVKWLKELTEIGKKDYKEIVCLMETLARLRGVY